jgi:hypothetical protein
MMQKLVCIEPEKGIAVFYTSPKGSRTAWSGSNTKIKNSLFILTRRYAAIIWQSIRPKDIGFRWRLGTGWASKDARQSGNEALRKLTGAQSVQPG